MSSSAALLLLVVLSITALPVHGKRNYQGCIAATSGFIFSGQSNAIGSATAGPLVSVAPTYTIDDCETECGSHDAGSTQVAVGYSSLADGWLCKCTTAAGGFTGVFATAPDSFCATACPGGLGVPEPVGENCGGQASQGYFAVYDDPCGGNPSVCDDPHFIGLDGARYEYMANANKTVALISDPVVEINSQFIGIGSNTFLGDTCVRACNDTVRVSPSGTILVNGRPLPVGRDTMTPSSALSVSRVHPTMVTVSAGSWRLTLRLMWGRYINIRDITYLAKPNNSIHGAFGVTGRADHRLDEKAKCQPSKEGGCELPGKWQDYELAAGEDLCSTRWAYSQFNARQC